MIEPANHIYVAIQIYLRVPIPRICHVIQPIEHIVAILAIHSERLVRSFLSQNRTAACQDNVCCPGDTTDSCVLVLTLESRRVVIGDGAPVILQNFIF